MGNFQLSGLDEAQFQHYFEQTDEELQLQDVKRMFATTNFGFPCRVSLQDASVGDELLLLPHWHHLASSPYRALGPIYVRRGATRVILPPGLIPDYVSRRVISIRAYDAGGMMILAEVKGGAEVWPTLHQMFDSEAVSYIHLHNAKPGCFSCSATRAATQP
jgi:hypothetical protein